MAKPGVALPERLSTRCYVHPYISDPIKADEELKSSSNEQASLLEQVDTPSSATLAAPMNSSSKTPREIFDSSINLPQKSYYWPMAHDDDFSGATKSAFEKKNSDSTLKATRKVAEEEAPVPRFFTDRDNFLAQHANITQKLESLRRAPEQYSHSTNMKFTIHCNKCEKAIPDAHWHCGICDAGDFDLCAECVEKGNLCENEEHWMIKRFVKDGKVIPSTTETIGPKFTKAEHEEKVPGAFTSDIKREETREPLDLSRTCNCCVGGKFMSRSWLCIDTDIGSL